MPEKNLAVVILAAGKGIRMQSSLAKVLHPLSGRPLLHYVLETVKELGPDRVIAVVGFQADKVKAAFPGRGIEFVEQEEQLGTGHAARQTESSLNGFAGDVMVLCGDMPLIRPAALTHLIKKHRESGASCTLLTLKTNDGEARDFGRILRDGKGAIVRIVENKDAAEAEKKVDEYNSGAYCFDKRLFYKALFSIDNSNSGNEYYLTDAVRFFVQNGHPVESVQTSDSGEIFGINSPEELKKAEQLLRDRQSSS